MEFITFKDLNKLRSIIHAVSTSEEVEEIVYSAASVLPTLFDLSVFGVLLKEGPTAYLFEDESCLPAFAEAVLKHMVTVFSFLGEEPMGLERVTVRVEKRRLRSRGMVMDPDATLKSHLTLPLLVDGEMIGCLSINGDQANMYSVSKLQFFSVFASQMAASLKHIQRFSTVKKEAIYDTLTSLFNRRYFEEVLSTEAQQSFQKGSNLSIIMVDLDHFKKVNDTFGHDAGDKVLREIASLLKNSVRKPDLVARYGGEEFVLLLPGALLGSTTLIAERIRSLVENTSYDVGKAQVHLTVSLGISHHPTHRARTKEELLKMADLALYEAKRRGRNQICIYGK